MTRKIPSYLKLHTGEQVERSPARVDDFPGLDQLCQAFQQATGWTMRYQPGEAAEQPAAVWSTAIPGREEPPGNLLIQRSGSQNDVDSLQSLESIRGLAASIAQLLGEVARLQHVVWQREAELAAGVPVTLREDEPAHLAERLEAILRGGAEAVGCQAAALYLLDEATSQLKLRACWGLPKERLLDEPRPLRGAVADLEALLGSAVVLEDTRLLPHWQAPEEFPAAVCVPISSPTTPLGTLWVFSAQPRDFSSHETNLLEIVAGRIASDLDREMLLTQCSSTRQLDRQLRHAAAWQHDRLPRIAPLLDDWKLAGWSLPADEIGGDFYDWCILPDGSLAAAIGDAQGVMIEAGLTAATLHTALKSHGCYRHQAREMIARVNETLWTASAGDQFASLFYALIQPETGHCEYAGAGHLAAFVLRENGVESLSRDTLPLGAQPESTGHFGETQLEPGDVLVLLSEGVRDARDAEGRLLGEEALSAALHPHRRETPQRLLERARQLIETHCDGSPRDDQTVLMVSRSTNRF